MCVGSRECGRARVECLAVKGVVWLGAGRPLFWGLGPQKTPAHEDGYTEIVKTSARQGPIRRVWIWAESVGAFTSRYILAAFSLPGK